MNDSLLVTILDKFSAGDIAELDFNDGKVHLVLRKTGVTSAAALHGQAPESVAEKKPAITLPPKRAIPLPKLEKLPEGIALNQTEVDAVMNHSSQGTAPKTESINSPIVATFYATPTPDAPPFVTPGTKVKAGATLCILEAMKMMNRLEAEFDCEIVAVKVATGDLVEYGQSLFEVKRLT
ncbi:MAG: acetyl-CoA carboxylase biotin carboxyl carrier protein subunit [Treponema sp.]|jgi:acetyl-CoA carboxylase biotin carboxyl carrier protein|nr:acetyl-CoA carboxylase biotin carboxyl carrier protein subunit [Treponema sp.]